MSTILIFQVVLIPVHAVLAWVYLALRLAVPRVPAFDATVILIGLGAWAMVVWMTPRIADPLAGPMWPIVLATFTSFLVFSGILAAGWGIRLWLCGPRR